MSSNFHEIESNEDFTGRIADASDRVVVLNFWAPWAEPCIQMNDVFLELAKKHEKDGMIFLQVEAENLPDVAESFEVEAVPSFVLIKKKKILARISGANAADLAATVVMHSKPKASGAQSTTTMEPVKANNSIVAVPSERAQADAATSGNGHVGGPVETDQQLEVRLKELTTTDAVMLFMKGNPATPRCGFSQKIVLMLKEQGIRFSTFDILSDETVRQGMKTFSDWPTFPQLYIGGEFVGGLDVVKEMAENGELKEMATEAGAL